jgi:transposase, IS5 family
VLTLLADGAESLWDEILPAEVKALPGDLAKLDELLSDSALLAPIAVRWERELNEASRHSPRGRPSIAMESYVRLMVIKHRSGWGYETLMREVSDSIHLRRFCRFGLSERLPDESTDDSYCESAQRLFGFAGGHAPVPPAAWAAG